MTYYIVGKKTFEGTIASDSKNGILNEYFELGWEYMVSHIYIKHLFVQGMLQPNDVIVSLRDRIFLYQGFWKNVLAYEDFRNLATSDEDQIIDVCNNIQNSPLSYLPPIDGNGKYAHWDDMVHVIRNIRYRDVSNLDTKNPFCCMHIRYRGWAEHRNLSEEFWKTAISKIKHSKLKIYVFGKEAAKFADGNAVVHVTLEEYASLLNNPNCKYVVGSMSGGTLVAQTFAHNKCTQYVIISDQQTLREFHTKDAYSVFYHKEAMNFSNSPTEHVLLFSENDVTNLIDKLCQ